MKSVEANEAGETMRVKLAAAEAEVERLRGLTSKVDYDMYLKARAEKAEAALAEFAGHQAWIDSAPDQWVMRKDTALAPAEPPREEEK